MVFQASCEPLTLEAAHKQLARISVALNEALTAAIEQAALQQGPEDPTAAAASEDALDEDSS
jgi:hypothetical protein